MTTFTLDANKNFIIADGINVKKVNLNGTVTIIAGNGNIGFEGDGGKATAARLNYPVGVAVDTKGNIFIADAGNHRIRKVDVNGIITTVAGKGIQGFSGDGGLATSASLNFPWNVAVDAANNLLIADFGNGSIRKVSTTGVITTIAGNGSSDRGGGFGDGGQANLATLYRPKTLAIDAAGSIYIGDNNRIRKVNSNGIISTFAGIGSGHAGDGGLATNASFGGELGCIAVGLGGSVVVADKQANCIREINASGIINTIAGIPNVSGFSGDEGDARSAQLAVPNGLVVDQSGAIFIGANYRIRKIAAPLTPTITGFTPTTANNASTVGITGKNLFGTSKVAFGGTTAPSYTITSDSTINAVVANTGASGSVSLVTRGGVASKAGFTFVFIAQPTIASFTPTSGKSGTSVIITGSNFLNATSVLIGATPAASFVINSSTKITAIVGGGSSGNVSVTTPGGTASRAGFTFTGPTISGFSPGLALAGQTININGANFTGVSAVKFGNVNAASFTVNSSTSISAVLGAGASGNVSVTTTNGTANRDGFIVIPVPTITSINPDKAGPLMTVTIIGSGFTGGSVHGFWVPVEVSFGGVAAQTYTVVHADTIIAKVAYGASGKVLVRTAGGSAIKEGFVYFPAPAIYNFSPQGSGKGKTITISGANFTGATNVSFGGTKAASFSVINATTISAVLASGASGNITVTTPGGTATSTSAFTFYPAPVINSFLPLTAGSGTNITITGSNFSGASAVRFGGVGAASFLVVNANTINAIVGAGATGNVSVITPGGTAVKQGYTFAIPLPTIKSFYPKSAAKGTEVILTGTALLTTKNVSFGTLPATSFSIVSDTVVKAVVGYGSSGTISLINAAGEATRIGFAYNPLPVITSFTPYGFSGDAITINGAGFFGTTEVKFGGVTATSFSVKSATKIIAFPGNGNSGNVSVKTPMGTVVKAGFLYVQNMCPGGSAEITSALSGSTYQWQVNTGNGFTNITGTNYSGINTKILKLVNIPEAWYNYQYRCLVDGEHTDPAIIRFVNRWIGTVNNAWENASNWGCATLPTNNSIVEISKGTVAVNSNVSVKSLKVQEGAGVNIAAGKKVSITGVRDSIFPIAKAEPKKIEKVSIEAGHALIFFVSPGLILKPGETTVTRVRQMNDNATDTIPSGLKFFSSDISVATIAADGTVTAKGNGSCLLSATDAAGRTAYCGLRVKILNVPDVTVPVFSGFEKPLFLLNHNTSGQIKVKALNRKGEILTNAVTISLSGNNSKLQVGGNTNFKAPEGSFIGRASVGQTNLEGETVVLIINKEASNLLGPVNQIITPKVFSVSLGPGKYPRYFTHVNMSSDPVIGLVYRLMPYKVYAGDVWTGAYGITISITKEQINVETENNSVISASGSRIVSMNEGVGRWRVIIENFYGEWYSSQVFANFAGEWISTNDKRGKSIKLNIPEIPSKIFYAGHYASIGELDDYYHMNWYAGSLAQAENGKAIFTDNVTGHTSSIINVEAGPGFECLICNFQTIQRAFGALHFIEQNRKGSIRFADKNTMLMSETDSSVIDVVFVRSVTEPVRIMNLKIDAETANIDNVAGYIYDWEDGYYEWVIDGYYHWNVGAKNYKYLIRFLGDEFQGKWSAVPVPGVTYNARIFPCPDDCIQPEYNVTSGYVKYNESGTYIGYVNFELCELVFTRVDAYRWEGYFKASGAVYDANDNKTGQISIVEGNFGIPVK